MSVCFSLDRSKVTLFSKLLDTLRAFVPEANIVLNEKGMLLSNLDSTHTVIAMGSLNSDFLGTVKRFGNTEESDNNGIAINLDELYKILKSTTTRLVQADFKIYDDKVETLLLGASQRQKSLFTLDTYHTDRDFACLSSNIDENLDEYTTKLTFSTVDFREILNSIKIFKSEQVTIQYEEDYNRITFLTGEHNQHKIEYVLPFLKHPVSYLDMEKEIIEEEIIEEMVPTEPIILQLGTDRLLYLARALQLSTNLQIMLKSDYHPVYFSFHIEDDQSNRLVIGLSPRNA